MWVKKWVEIRVVVFKQQFSLFKHRYQTGPNLWLCANHIQTTEYCPSLINYYTWEYGKKTLSCTF